MLKLIRRFFQTREANPYLVVLCLLLASLAEVVGIGTLLPVIGIAAGSEAKSQSDLARTVEHLLSVIGVPSNLGMLVVIVAVFMLIKAVLSFAAIAYATAAAARVALSIRKRLLSAVLDARWSYFSEQRSGKITNIIGFEASQAAEGYIVSANVVAAAIQTIAYCAIAVTINPVARDARHADGHRHNLHPAQPGAARQKRRLQADRQPHPPLELYGRADGQHKGAEVHEPAAADARLDLRTVRRLRRAFLRRELAKAGLARAGDAITVVDRRPPASTSAATI